MKLVDSNVLLYARNEASAQHEAARSWLDRALAGREPVAFTWVVILSFLRVATNRMVYPRPLSVDDAVEVMERWLTQPASVVLEATPRHLSVLHGFLRSVGTAANLVNDTHLAALAVEHGATVASFDRDFQRFEGVRWELPKA